MTRTNGWGKRIGRGFVLLGFFLLLFPIISNWWNDVKTNALLSAHAKTVKGSSWKEEWAKADAYNQKLSFLRDAGEDYDERLNGAGTGLMGSIQIPKLGLSLPVYHGVSDAVLAAGIGHLPESSLPTGKPGTHAVLSGHTGLASKDLFTRLPELAVGDTFSLQILDEQFVYTVTNIQTVYPEELSVLSLDESCSKVTLLTCVPPENAKRLLVTGERKAGTTYSYSDPFDQDARLFFLLFFLTLLLLLVQYHMKRRIL